MTKLTDNSIMMFGPYKGQAMANVPEDYLSDFYNQNSEDFIKGVKMKPHYKRVILYIMDYTDLISI